MDAKLASSHERTLVVVKEDHHGWLHTKTLTGQFKDASIRFGNSYLVGVDDQINQFLKLVTLLLFLPGPNKTITQKGGLIAWAQTPKIVNQFSIGLTKILCPEIMKKIVSLHLIHPKMFAQTTHHIFECTFPQRTIMPKRAHPLVQFPRFEMETLLPLFRQAEVRGDFQDSTDVKNNGSNGHSSLPFRDIS